MNPNSRLTLENTCLEDHGSCFWLEAKFASSDLFRCESRNFHTSKRRNCTFWPRYKRLAGRSYGKRPGLHMTWELASENRAFHGFDFFGSSQCILEKLQVQVKNTFLHFVHGSMEINEERHGMAFAKIVWPTWQSAGKCHHPWRFATPNDINNTCGRNQKKSFCRVA